MLKRKTCHGLKLHFLQMLSDNTKVGVILVSLGFFFLFLGVVLFFDSGLLAIGNVLLLVGIPFIIGFQRALHFFNPFRRKEQVRGIVCFFAGITLVLLRWSVIGLILELIGMVEMFGKLLPIVVSFLRGVPYVGRLFSLPGVATVIDWLSGAGRARRAPV